MRTGAKQRILRIAHERARELRQACRPLEEAAGVLHDPELIEHAVIAQLAIRHYADRARELELDQADEDEPELELEEAIA